VSTKLSGKVTVHGSKPAKTAVVEVSNSDGDVVDQVQVGDDGSYTYHLSSGVWSLRVWDSHGHRGSALVTISDEDEEKAQNFDLEEPEGGH
jgi:hypothetical protein